MNTRFLFPVPGLLLCAGIVLIALAGCSSTHSLQIDLSQPVYFGKAPQSALPLDTAHVQTVKPILVQTTHVVEKEKVIKGKSTTFTKDASEDIQGDVAAQVEEAMENDSDRFVANAEFRTEVEAYIPLTTFFTDFLASIFLSDSKAEGMGEASSETIEVAGTVYKVRRVK